MQRTKRRFLECFISCILIAAMTITGISVPESRAKADTTNPIDTGRGYEYSNGKALGKYLRIEKYNTTNDTDTLKIIADEYNLTNFRHSFVYGGQELGESLRYPGGYLSLLVDIDVPDSDSNTGYGSVTFYALTDKNYIIMDYGISDRGYDTPYGSTQKFDYLGYDRDGYDITGYNRNGYDKDGYDKDGYNKDGYNKDGYNKEGYDKSGYDKDGYDSFGYDKDGYGRDGYNRDGYDRDGYNKDGYDKNWRDRDGYNMGGYDIDGYNREGYDSSGYNRDGYDKDGYKRNGYDKEGYNKEGYNKEGYNKEGYNRNGYNKDGYDKDGYDWIGYDKDGYDKDGYNKDGYDRDGYKRNGYDKEGYDRDGYDRDGYDKNGNYNQHDKTKDDYGKDGYNGYGYDKDGYNRLGINKDGYNKKGEKAKSKVDTGEGYEYNITGGGCGINVNNDTGEFCEIVSSEYNITYNKNDSKSLNSIIYRWKKSEVPEEFKSIRYPEGYTYKYLKIDKTYIYCLTDSAGKVYDYGKIDASNQSDISGVAANLPSIPLGGKEAYDYYGCSKDGYNKNGLDYQGFGRDGYNKKNRNRNGYDKKGYLYTEGETSSERAVPIDFTALTESYIKNLKDEWEDGYFYENGVYNYDKINDFNYVIWYQDGRFASVTERYDDEHDSFIDIGDIDYLESGNGTFNFNIPNKDKIRKSYSGYTDMLSIVERQEVGYIKDKKTELKEENCIKSYTLYITPAKFCRLYTGKYIEEENVNKFKFLNKGKSYKITGSYKDVIVLADDTGEDARKFSYKLVPSTKNVSNLKISAYKGKMISADKTDIQVKAKQAVSNDVYLANINAKNITVTSSNKAIVKVSKKNKAGDIYCTLKLIGGSKKGKATVTIKDKKSGKKQKITVTNAA